MKMDISDDEGDISTQEENKCVNETVKAILVLDHTKKPFKQNEIAAFLSQKPNRKRWNAVLDKAKEKLMEMGLILVELKNTSTRTFFLSSSIHPVPSMYRFASENEVADRTLLILVLTFIFMKERAVTNDEIFNHLKQLNIYSENRSIHPYFGDIKKKILTEFVSQLYLEKVQVDKESDTFEIRWGERANVEVSKISILKFVCEIGYEGTVEPKNMASHYKKAMEEEKQRNGQDADELLLEDDQVR